MSMKKSDTGRDDIRSTFRDEAGRGNFTPRTIGPDD